MSSIFPIDIRPSYTKETLSTLLIGPGQASKLEYKTIQKKFVNMSIYAE